MQMIGLEMQDSANITPALRKVFVYVGEGARIKTARGVAPPLTTGTFGALDMYQTLLGEIDDRLSAMSIPGLKIRTTKTGWALQVVAKHLISLLGGLTPNFERDILKIQQATTIPNPVTWVALESGPGALWESIEPVLKLRDDIVKWVYDNLAVRVVQDALAAISAAIDKLVYMVLGIFLGPVLSELSKALESEE